MKTIAKVLRVILFVLGVFWLVAALYGGIGELDHLRSRDIRNALFIFIPLASAGCGCLGVGVALGLLLRLGRGVPMVPLIRDERPRRGATDAADALMHMRTHVHRPMR